MLNITDNTVSCAEDLKDLEAPQKNVLAQRHFSFRKFLLILLVVFVAFMLLPWTQNIQATGKVTTERPEQRPQTIHATISGRIEHWYVTEGQFVRKGDTIVHLSEVKSDYFDPALVDRVGNQVNAKQGSIQAYSGKVGALDQQIAAMEREQVNKLNQIRNKIQQARLKIEADSINIIQAQVDSTIAQRQYEANLILYNKGIKPLIDLEKQREKLLDARTKLVAAINKFQSSKNDLQIYIQEWSLTQNEYANKIAKANSDKFSTLSDQFDAEASVNKLQIERENYSRRMSFYFIVAPQDGYIVKAIRPGIGEIIKEGDPVVSVQPADYGLAVEMYVRPLDLPLIEKGQKVRFLFDGWPAFFFSGWPGASMGTFGGKVIAIDRNISANNKFRVLVAPDSDEQPWPQALQPGGGARGIALLKNVPVWYELWRVLNGFPPDMYEALENGDTEKKDNGLVPKAPIKSAK